MRAIIQRVSEASVLVDNQKISSIGLGCLVFIGIHRDDTNEDRDYIIKKILKLRLFPSENKNIDKNIQDINGELLLVSQFTLYADCSKGNRPSFTQAMDPERAAPFFQDIVQTCRNVYSKTESGIFGAMMEIRLVNEGPVTIILKSKKYS